MRNNSFPLAAVLILLASIVYIKDIEEAYDLHQIHAYELRHLDDGNKL